MSGLRETAVLRHFTALSCRPMTSKTRAFSNHASANSELTLRAVS